MVGGLPIGTGPYVMEEGEDSLTLTPNPHYAGEETRFQEATIAVTAPGKVREALESGSIDAVLFAQNARLPECIEGKHPRIRCAFGQEGSHVVVVANGLPQRLFSSRDHRLALCIQVVLKK